MSHESSQRRRVISELYHFIHKALPEYVTVITRKKKANIPAVFGFRTCLEYDSGRSSPSTAILDITLFCPIPDQSKIAYVLYIVVS